MPRKAGRNLLERNCLKCGKLFLVPPYRKDTAKYCSKKCHLMQGSSEMICDVCGKQYRIIGGQNAIEKRIVTGCYIN